MRFAKWLILLIFTVSLCGCSGIASEIPVSAPENPHPLAGEIKFGNDEYAEAFNPGLCIPITLTGDGAECASGYVEISGNKVTILKGGSYTVSGELSGMLAVHADKNDTVRIILSGASISSPTSAAIYIYQTGKTIITSAENTVNRLSNGGQYIDIDDNNIDAVIFSKDDLCINGAGSLVINAEAGHGIVSKDSLRIANANLDITSNAHALSAKDDIGIDGGKYALRSGKDGIHVENKDDAALGNVLILGGSFDINSGGDGVSAGNILQLDGGDFAISSGGGHSNAPAQNDDFMRFRNDSAAAGDNASSKAFKSAGNMYINGGKLDIDASDDALHSNADLRICSGIMDILTGDDALHADNKLGIYGGDIRISSSYEGLEGHTIDVTGGNISLSASDDGMNAAGGNDGSGMGTGFRRDNPFMSDAEAYIHISGGEIYILCGGDGIDSNGEIRISGGKTIVMGPASGANGSLDCGTDAYISGGVFCALGSSQMAEHFSGESGQCSLIVNLSGGAGDTVSVADASGNVLFETTAQNSFDCIVLSLPEFEIGENFQLNAGENEADILFESTLYSTTAGGFFGGMMGPGGRGQSFPWGNSSGRGPSSPEGFAPPGGMTPPDNMQIPGGMDFREKPSMP